MLYQAYEVTSNVLAPVRLGSQMLRAVVEPWLSPFSDLVPLRAVTAGLDVFEGLVRRYGKPEWELPTTVVDGKVVTVTPTPVHQASFCDLLHFKRDLPARRKPDPKVYVVAPLSGHYATLLRGTVEAMLPGHEVYITDWANARTVPLSEGRFDLDDAIDTIIGHMRFLGEGVHVIAVCQPAVPVLAAVSLMAAEKDPFRPRSMTLMGGPIDTRRNPTQVNTLAMTRDIRWFERNVIYTVPFPHAGIMRRVYPGFMQLSGFMTMNLDRHVGAHWDLFRHLVDGDGDSVAQHQKFYDEYLSVMDLTAEFYLQTIQTVFQRHDLPNGKMMHRDRRVDPGAIEDVALLTVEGERDDICGIGQTSAAMDLCRNLPENLKTYYMQPRVGHYGVFNGSRWRNEIQPRVAALISAAEDRAASKT